MDQRKCFTCFKSHQLCICKYINRIECKQKIIILQHPKEKFHPYNTAIIAKLSLKNCSILTGEDFSENEVLNRIIKEENCILAYPDKIQSKENKNIEIKNMTLILIDATWKKANKIFFLSKNIQKLPRLSIMLEQKSIYQIRKSSLPQSLSTIEAITYILDKNHTGNFETLLIPLKKMIEYSLKYQGEDNETT